MSILFALSVSCSACSSQGRAPLVRDEHKSLGGAVAVRVVDTEIPISMVAGVARAQSCTPMQAAQKLADDAVLSHEASARKLDQSPAVALDLVRARAATDAKRIDDDALALGPATDQEVLDLAKVFWRDFDIDPQWRVVHALVKRPVGTPKKPLVPGTDARAKAVAQAIADAERGAKDEADFFARAQAVPHEGLEIVTQEIPRFLANGSYVDGAEGVVRPFADAAITLKLPGETTHVVETEFGWHVIRLIELLPAKHATLAEKRSELADQVLVNRQQKAIEDRLTTLKTSAHIEILPTAETLMASVFEPAPE